MTLATISDVRRTHAAALRLFREGSADLAALLIARAGRLLLPLLNEKENGAIRARLLEAFPEGLLIDPGDQIPGSESRDSFLWAADAVAEGIYEIDTPRWEAWVSRWARKGFGFLAPVAAWWKGRPWSVKAGVVAAILLIGVGFGIVKVRSMKTRRASQGVVAEIFSDPSFNGPAQRITVKKLSFDSIDEIHPTHPDRKEQFSVRFSGFLFVPHDGRYQFSMFEDDSAAVWIDDVSILDSIIERNGQKALDLKRGFHPLRVDYVQWMGGGEFHLYWEANGAEKSLIGPENLFVRIPSRS